MASLAQRKRLRRVSFCLFISIKMIEFLTSTFNIRCWTFDVRCSFFFRKPSTVPRRKKNLALMGRSPYLYISVAPFLFFTLLGFLDFGPCISQGYGSVKHRSFLKRISGVGAKIPQPQKLVPAPGCGLGQTRLKLA